MKGWSTSALNGCYLDPVVRFLNAGYRDSAGAAVAISGYYVTPRCDLDCCQAFGGISKIDMGRSAQRVKPENGPGRNLVENG
jgi:hypothetical protein